MELGGDHQQYGLPDLRNLLSGRTPYFPTFTQPQEQLNLNPSHYDLLMLGSQVVGNPTTTGVVDVAGFSDSTTTSATTPTPLTTTAATATITSLCGFDQIDGGGINGVDGGNGRWPRQETLTLLEVRSHLDSKFKEANQKGPLWDEVSRIMAEEHGYQRSGKKCREKFENLYKYYKKTKEGKAGRQDGKHYRFFRQLEALYGDSSNQVSEPLHFTRYQPSSNMTTSHEGLSIDNSSSFDSSSSEDGDNHLTGKTMAVKDSKRGRRSWKSKIKDFVDSQMRKLIETQDAWLEKMLKTIEQKEHERMSREEEWRRREAARIDQEHKFWANERAWFEARDAALMEALRKVTGKELKASSSENLMGIDLHENNGSVESTLTSFDKWSESEISTLINLRTNMESRFQLREHSKETLWIEISAKMACLGYDKSAKACEEKWDYINRCIIRRSNECTKKHRENLRTSPHIQYPDSSYNHEAAFYGNGNGINQQGQGIMGISSSTDGPSNVGTAMSMSDSYYPRFLMAEGDTFWEK